MKPRLTRQMASQLLDLARCGSLAADMLLQHPSPDGPDDRFRANRIAEAAEWVRALAEWKLAQARPVARGRRR